MWGYVAAERNTAHGRTVSLLDAPNEGGHTCLVKTMSKRSFFFVEPVISCPCRVLDISCSAMKCDACVYVRLIGVVPTKSRKQAICEEFLTSYLDK